ncbi:MAG TPA: hypothetical protein GXX25_04420 [Desulfotomaculum sp.]|nr:hypothetical protein [Desulfotomaculum sp.]
MEQRAIFDQEKMVHVAPLHLYGRLYRRLHPDNFADLYTEKFHHPVFKSTCQAFEHNIPALGVKVKGGPQCFIPLLNDIIADPGAIS